MKKKRKEREKQIGRILGEMKEEIEGFLWGKTESITEVTLELINDYIETKAKDLMADFTEKINKIILFSFKLFKYIEKNVEGIPLSIQREARELLDYIPIQPL